MVPFKVTIYGILLLLRRSEKYGIMKGSSKKRRRSFGERPSSVDHQAYTMTNQDRIQTTAMNTNE